VWDDHDGDGDGDVCAFFLDQRDKNQKPPFWFSNQPSLNDLVFLRLTTFYARQFYHVYFSSIDVCEVLFYHIQWLWQFHAILERVIQQRA
jgi:hypothetical protein